MTEHERDLRIAAAYRAAAARLTREARDLETQAATKRDEARVASLRASELETKVSVTR